MWCTEVRVFHPEPQGYHLLDMTDSLRWLFHNLLQQRSATRRLSKLPKEHLNPVSMRYWIAHGCPLSRPSLSDLVSPRTSCNGNDRHRTVGLETQLSMPTRLVMLLERRKAGLSPK
jgi:hypothetical protein